ncbi:unnamed protein product [Paramecium sonneborni]|uniref:EGF-like domain-containing protein n=1 Tax=Paramecium sonneborni TaxID=65129 RepID=A0A8S1RDX1_9CILI|nr:unnamed protein product [Paramecium sonneborni]
MIQYLISLTLVKGFCDYTCLTCQEVNTCLTCPSTRNLINQECYCKDSMIELQRIHSNQCFECNKSCRTCKYEQRNYCLTCYTENKRKPENGECVCEIDYQPLKNSQKCVPITQNAVLTEILEKSFEIDGPLKKLGTAFKYDNTILQNFQDTINTVKYQNEDNVKESIQIINHNKVIKDSQGRDLIQLQRENVFVLGTIISQQFIMIFDYGQDNVKVHDKYQTMKIYGENSYDVQIFQYSKQQTLLVQIGIQKKQLNSQIQESLVMSFLLSYKIDGFVDFLDYGQLEKLIDFAIQLIRFCNDPLCESCSFYYNKETCEVCKANTELDLVTKVCVCRGIKSPGGDQCYKKCNNSECVGCIEGVCIKCDSDCSTIIEKCDDGYYEQDQRCFQCPNQCTICQSETQCTSCIDNYYNDNEKCHQCVDPCKNCKSVSDCLSCIDGYFIEENRCLLCSVINECLICENSSQCRICKKGFYLNEQLGCSKCKQECLSCSSYNFCEQCIDGYFNNSIGDCRLCNGNCQVCPNSNQCNVCKIGYFVQQKICNNCDTNCTTCSESSSECYSCTKDKSLIQNKCVSCQPPCLTCINTITTCQSCINDNYYLESNACIQCISPCLRYTTTGLCKKCEKQCSSCCIECLTKSLPNGNCIYCQSQCNQCITNSSNCETCLNGYFMNGLNCQVCSQNCQTCYQSSTNCLSCKQGYYLNEGICNECDQNCQECISLEKCTKCKQNYILNQEQKCQLISCKDSQCITCYNEDSCAKCGISKYLSNNKCLPCSEYCKSCENKSDECLSCFQRYYLDQKQCLECDAKCATCTTTSYNCNECALYYFEKDGDCIKCSIFCRTCKENHENCTSCFNSSYLENNKCINCSDKIQSCIQCNNSSTCLKCQDEYYLENAKCYDCPFSCSKCISYNNCTECKTNAYSPSQGKCVKCPEKCKGSCQMISTTQIICKNGCSDGYYQKDGDCLKCSSPCRTCKDNATNCLSCITGHYYELVFNDSCHKCSSVTYDNCGNCETPDHSCAKCLVGYILTPTAKTCLICNDKCSCPQSQYYDWDLYTCQPCNQNCLSCIYSPSNCTQCTSSQFLDQDRQKCLECKPPCKSCSAIDLCTTCIDGYVQNNGICQTCHFDNCLECSNNKCTQCQTGYFKTQDFQCEKCSSNCLQCDSKQSCQQCNTNNNQIYLYNGICKSCTPPCLQCNQSECSQCPIAYYISSQNCQPCLSNCQICKSEIGCTLCLDSYYFDGINCNSCSNKFENCKTCTETQCLNCQNTFYLNTDYLCQKCLNPYCQSNCTQEQCQDCGEGCIKCNLDKICYSCLTNYYLEQGSCKSCHQFCLKCNYQECLQCQTGYYSEGKDCKKCISDCQICDKLNCYQCPDKYYIKNQECKKCQPNCLSCTENKCELCENDQFYPHENLCVKCQGQCLTCINKDQCTKCQQDYYYLDNSECKKCQDGCKNCNKDQCNLCEEQGYYLDETGQCFKCKQEQCLNCLKDKCTKCQQNEYFLSKDICQPCPSNCLTCINENQCSECKHGFILKNQLCQKECAINEYLDQDTCHQCSDGCEQCESKEICIICSSPLFLHDQTRTCQPQADSTTINVELIVFVTIAIILHSVIIHGLIQLFNCIFAPFIWFFN